MRLRTLPLSVAGIIVGNMASYNTETFSWTITTLALLTVLALQTVSNLANELGDTIKHADAQDRQGPKRGIQTGKVTKREIATLIVIFSALSAAAGLALIAVSLGGLFTLQSIIFVAFGALCIAAAIYYTLGKKPYGYMCLGDISVFLFFGLMSVLGVYYLQCKIIELYMLLPATSIGALSVAVLNVNNMRDMPSDLRANKRTLALCMGMRGARIYQATLIIVTIITWGLFAGWKIIIPFVPIWGYHVYKCFITSGSALDKQLPLVSLTTMTLAIVYAISVLFIS